MTPDPSLVPGGRPPANLRFLGIAFTVLGVLSILLPAAASVAAVLVLAATMAFWGIFGVMMSFAMRPHLEWRVSALAFGLLGLLGVAFMFWPRSGIEAFTLFIVAAFFVEGAASILFAYRLRDRMPGWFLMALSGLASLVLAIFVLAGWPGTAQWALGLILGVNFLTTGLSLMLIGP